MRHACTPRLEVRFRTSILCTAIFASAGAAQTCDPIESGQGYTCTPTDGSDAYYIGSGGGVGENYYTPTTWPAITPDRRPVVWLLMFSGNQTCSPHVNPKAHNHWWRDATSFTETDGLRDRLQVYWDAGFRRMVLERPGGGITANIPGTNNKGKVPQAHYWHLSATQQDILDDLGVWIYSKRFSLSTDPAPDPTFEFGAFIGSWQGGSPCTPCLTAAAGGSTWECDDDDDVLGFTYNTRFFDTEAKTSMIETYENFIPWLDLGFDAIWLDNASTWDMDADGTKEDPDTDYVGPERLLDLLQSPDYAGVKIGGESIPRDLDADDDPIDTTYSDKAAWFATYKNAVQWDWFTTNLQSTNPDTTELGICFMNPDPDGTEYDYGLVEVAAARDAGFLIWISHTEAIPFVQRLYDGENDEFYDALYATGDLTDFDADGTGGTVDDFNAFCTNWNANRTLSGDDLAYWDGDIDNDDDVDCADLAAFLSLKSWGYTCINPCP